MKYLVYFFFLMGLATGGAEKATALGLEFVETAGGIKSKDSREIIQWTHSRLVFKKDLERVAVGQDSIIKLEVLDNNEVLALAKKVGRTSIMVWYSDGSSESFLFSVTEDLSVLHQVLKDIHPGIKLTLAPDRAALILRGLVPNVRFKMAAESAARHYLEAGQPQLSSDLLIQSPASTLLANLDANLRIRKPDSQPVSALATKSAIINLIQVETLPMDLIEKIKKTISGLGGQSVKVTRIQKGDLANDDVDTILLSGQVETQVDLIRVVKLASRLFSGNELAFDPSNTRPGMTSNNTNDTLSIVANESGGLIEQSQSSGSGGASGLGGAGSSNGLKINNVRSNIGRAKLLSMAGGRLISTIEVRDLPQVRVAIQMYEVNRRRLKQWKPDFSVMTNGYSQDEGLFGLQGATSRAAGAGQIENAMQLLGGALVNNLQVGGSEFAFDLLFSMLEEEGISRTLSRPNITVLAGESAVFRAGGEVPVPTAFAASGIANNDQGAGVFSGTEFKSFGVQLEVRAMVDENDLITLDLSPTISSPDTLLTQQISGSTGSSLNTSAFNVRSLSTSTRLRDGQPLVIGGLVSHDTGNNQNGVPGLKDIPVLGKITQAQSDSNLDRELFIIVTPTLVREPKQQITLWQFPSSAELLSMSTFQ